MNRIVECVPNFSEGRRPEVIQAIADSIASVEEVKVLHIDAGQAANRTVITFAGPPEGVLRAAFLGVKTASERIDMRLHHGEHPRIGATDVLPIVPVSGVTLEECAVWARELSRRIYEELGIPVYCYEAAAFVPEHRNLAVCRRGEYESLPTKMFDMESMPDFGGGTYTGTVARSGASVVGARDFLIAVNFNLNTTSVKLASSIAFDVREKGRNVIDENGNTVHIPGSLKGCKALGWYIEEYGIAQVSMNITDRHATPLHVAFEEVSRAADRRGLRVTGTEIIGLVPLDSLLDAGKHFAWKDSFNGPFSQQELIQYAVSGMGLDDLAPFEPSKKVLEFLL